MFDDYQMGILEIEADYGGDKHCKTELTKESLNTKDVVA